MIADSLAPVVYMGPSWILFFSQLQLHFEFQFHLPVKLWTGWWLLFLGRMLLLLLLVVVVVLVVVVMLLLLLLLAVGLVKGSKHQVAVSIPLPVRRPSSRQATAVVHKGSG